MAVGTGLLEVGCHRLAGPLSSDTAFPPTTAIVIRLHPLMRTPRMEGMAISHPITTRTVENLEILAGTMDFGALQAEQSTEIQVCVTASWAQGVPGFPSRERLRHGRAPPGLCACPPGWQ